MSSRKREIRHFHVVVMPRRKRNVQKSVMHVQSCCFANLNPLLLFFPVLVFAVVVDVVAETPFRQIQRLCDILGKTVVVGLTSLKRQKVTKTKQSTSEPWLS